MEKLFYNGDIVTMEGPDAFAEAVLVADGKIKAVGGYDAVAAQKGADCQMVDLQGRTLMPSFIDAHGHAATMAPMFASLCDLSECNNFAEIVETMKQYQAERQIPAGEPIVGVNYDDNFLEEGKHPHRDLLDTISTDHPVVLLHVSVHAAAVNSMALASVGYKDGMDDIPGGEVGHYADGRLNGYLAEAASYPVLGSILGAMQQKIVELWPVAQEMYLSNGITTVQDGGGPEATLQMLLGLDQAGKMKLDIVAYETSSDEAVKTMRKYSDMCGAYRGHVKIGGYKIILDGAPQMRTAWMTKPYEGSTECGVPILPDADVEKWVKRAMDDNMQILAHCNGDAAGDQFLNSIEKMLPLSSNPNKENLRFTMIHCQTVRKDQLERMARLKMIPSIFVSHVNYWGDVHMKNFGPERGSRVSPVKEALDAGLVYNFHTDTPVVKPKLLHAVWAAVNRVTRSGRVIGPELRIGVYDALKGITINAAYEYFEENEKGSIKAGKRADLVILSDDPLKVDPMTIKDIRVLETIKDGETVYTA